MFLKVIGPVGHVEELAVDNHGLSLGTLFGGASVQSVKINGRRRKKWHPYIPQRGDRIEVRERAADYGIISGPAVAGAIGTGATASAIIAGTLNVLIALTISMALSAIVRALTPKASKPDLDSNHQTAFGIAGFRNTTGRGTPAFIVYGQNRVFGHVISSGATLSPDGKQMWGRILYFMGDTGGDGYHSITDVRVDGTSTSQYPDMQVHVRLGTDPQQPIEEFGNLDSLISPSVAALDFDPSTGIGTPLIYTTAGNNINRVTLFLNFPAGLYRVTDMGKHRIATVSHKLEIKKNSEGSWTELPFPDFAEYNPSGMFKSHEINFPSADKWDIRLTVTSWVEWKFGDSFVGTSLLFNVQETVFTNKTYPGWALLGLTNIPSKQIQSMENMNVSALVEGKNVKRSIGGGNFELVYTRQRCWIVMDMMTHSVVGMGSEIGLTEIDADQWQQESQAYYDELVASHDAMEPRDLCDVIVADSDWDWEWVKRVAGEGRGRIIPSGSKWKYVIDRPDIANILYSEGVNVIDGSVQFELAPPDKTFTEVSAQFRDADKDYEDDFSPPIKDPEALSVVPELLKYDTITRESQVQRENMIVFKRNFLERRRWSFASPMGAIVSEANDLDYFAERGIGNEGAYGGILPGGQSTTVIDLPDIVTLQLGSTYALIIKHFSDNTTEYRTVATPAGDWGMVTVSQPFVEIPEEGDAFSLGIQNVDHVITRAQGIEIDQDGRIKQVRTEYIPEVYTQDPLPPKSVRRFFNFRDNRPPIPLRYANVQEQVSINSDGSTRSMLSFTVTPGLAQHSGIAQGGGLNGIALASLEPGLDNYFIDAKVTVNGEQRVIFAYDGNSRIAAVSPDFSVVPQPGDQYTIVWELFGVFGGFVIELSEDGQNFSPFATVNDVHYESDGRGAGPGPVYFRFTPFSNTGVRNVLARYILGITLVGDLSAPDPPQSVTITSYLLTVRVLVVLAKPVAEDFNGVEIQVWRVGVDPVVQIELTRFGAPPDSSAGGGTMQIEATFNLGARQPPEVYGAQIWAAARTVDYSQNYSDWVAVPDLAVLHADPASVGIGVGPPAVPTGLFLQTGTVVDPYDGVIKPYLLISWSVNTEPDMASYEVQYRLQSDGPGLGPLTARVVSHPQISLREIGLIGGVVYEARVQAIDLTNNRSGFTAWMSILIAHDVTPPPPPQMYSILGGFEMMSIYFYPPSVPDFAFVEAWIAFVSDINQAYRIERSAPDSISIRAAGLPAGDQNQDVVLYYVWLRAFDTSGNASEFDRTPFDGHWVFVRRITGQDVVQFSNLITNTAQIANAIITNAHIQSLAADKILTGSIMVALRLSAGGNVFIDGPNRVFTVYDDNVTQRVQMGRLGPSAPDYGLQIFGADGSLWHSLTGGTQSKGRQDVNVATFSLTLFAGGAHWCVFSGVFGIQNDTTTLTVRITASGSIQNPQAEINVYMPAVDSIDKTIVHNLGKTVMFSASLTGISGGGENEAINATLVVHYW